MGRFNLKEIYGAAFGTSYNNTSIEAFVPKSSSLTQIETPNVDADITSLFGALIHFPLSFDGYIFPNEPLISITGKNRIIKTPLDGSDGTFKELFSLDDYSITIKGIAVNEENEEDYPFKIIRKIRELCESGSVKVNNKLLSIFNINYLAIESYSFPAVEGAMWQAYEIQCLSDKPFDLELQDA